MFWSPLIGRWLTLFFILVTEDRRIAGNKKPTVMGVGKLPEIIIKVKIEFPVRSFTNIFNMISKARGSACQAFQPSKMDSFQYF